jgi:amino acid transporter/thiamine kinase-like enzyme
MGPFASFALAMSTICILAGGVTSFPQGYCSVGGAAIGIGWPLWLLFSLAVALTMGQVASAFPRAGGPCEWAAELAGPGWGWVAGCFNLAGLITVLTAVNMGFCDFVTTSVERLFQITDVPPWVKPVAVIVTTATQAAINHRGIRLTTLLTNFSGYLIVVVAVGLTVLLVVHARFFGEGLPFERLWQFGDNSGPKGGDVWPAWPEDEETNISWLFCLGLLLPAYTFTGFDASAQTAEETRDPETNVPKAIWQAVLISGLAGWIMLSALVLAIPAAEMADVAKSGETAFVTAIRAATPRETHAVIYIGIGLAQYFCGLAVVTAASRLMWALARDDGLLGARYLRRIGSFKTPAVAIWTVAVLACLGMILGYAAISAVCAVFFYVAYIIPTACGLYTYGQWPRMGPWHLGRWYPPLAVICIVGCLFLFVLAVQPPTQSNLIVIPAMIVAVAALWFAYFRYCFRDEVTRALRKLAAFKDSHEITIKPLGGGLTNRNYKVEIDGQTYVLRISGAGAANLLIDRPREMVAVKAAAAAGVAPEVVEHLPDYSVVVTRFVHGKQLTAEHTAQPEVLQRVARVLRRYHDNPVPNALGAFSAIDAVRTYFEQARVKGVAIPPDLERAMAMLTRIESEVAADRPHCLCHNDLLMGNFIDAGHALLLIDWEYAALGDRFFDLGNFAAHNQLSEADERLLLATYFGEVRSEDLRCLQVMRLVSDLRESTWGYLQSAHSTLHPPQYYLDYGRRFLDRFLSAPIAKELG